MHFHVPKPLHGWRAFIGEVGIIVLGVLIALSAEQLAEQWHWRNLVHYGRSDLAESYTTLRAQMRERQLISPCLDRRFDEIATFLEQASASGRIPPIGEIGQPRMRTISEPIWPALVATGTAMHFPRNEALQYNAIEAYVELWKADQQREREAWTRLYTIVGPGRSIEQSELGNLRAALSQAVFEARMLKLYSHLVSDRIVGTRLNTSGWINQKFIAGVDFRHPDKLLSQDPCRPIPSAPPRYGQAPMSGVDMQDPNRAITPQDEQQFR
jgi:hypothetical protein